MGCGLDVALRPQEICQYSFSVGIILLFQLLSVYTACCQAYIYLAPCHVLLPQQPAPPPRFPPLQ